jgi:hypothetical protein
MRTAYFRRFRMEIDLQKADLRESPLPQGYSFLPWDLADLERHALVKYESFRSDLDSAVFPCLGDLAGCQRLMHEIASQQSFLPGATWLLVFHGGVDEVPVGCGTIQGLAQGRRTGAIQNVGIVPAHRGLGLGRALLLRSLSGFRAARVRRVYLEVTADNSPAVNLYRSAGFRLMRTMYKSVELEEASAV